jgi:hypothetical protein
MYGLSFDVLGRLWLRPIPPCHADVRQPVYQGILFLDGSEERSSA